MANADEAFKESVRYLELDPVSPSPKLHLGWQYLQQRQYDQGIEQYTQIFEQDPNYTQAHRQIGDAFYFKGMYDEAVEAYLRAFTLQKSKPENIDALRKAYRTSGIKKYLHEHIRILKDARSEAELYSNNAYQIAANYALLGKTELAFEWLERAFADRSPLMVELKTALYFESINSDVRYKELSRRVGLPD